LIELAILIKIGSRIGVWNTIAIVVLTGIFGAILVRHQGFWVLVKIKEEIQQGKFPADELFDGAIILVGATLLITPGILTDIIGILSLVPSSREWIKYFIKLYIKKHFFTYRNY
ncbi:MAG: membrane protein FxsA, partial [Candidatus Cloacimonadota bacterium]